MTNKMAYTDEKKNIAIFDNIVNNFRTRSVIRKANDAVNPIPLSDFFENEKKN